MIFEVDSVQYDFQELYGYVVKTIVYDELPAKRYTKEEVIGKHGSYVFTDGYKDKNITVLLTLADSPSLATRRFNARTIKELLTQQGFLILDYESDIKYKARVLDATAIEFYGSYDILEIPFVCHPLAYSNINEDTTWAEININWSLADFTWGGADTQETFTAGTHTITNRGNETSEPVYVVSGAGTVTIGTESFTVTEGCIIDVDKKVVYNAGVNKMSSFTGDFIELAPGESTLTTNVEIKVHNKDRWV